MDRAGGGQMKSSRQGLSQKPEALGGNEGKRDTEDVSLCSLLSQIPMD
jgi:hypothetical protein